MAHCGDAGAPAPDTAIVAGCGPGETLALLALQRLAARLDAGGCSPHLRKAPGSSDPFLQEHRDAVVEGLRHGVRRALLALEVALRGESLWDRVASDVPREPRQWLLPQAWALRELFVRAGSFEDDMPTAERVTAERVSAERLGLRLRRLRRAGGFFGDQAWEVTGADLVAWAAAPRLVENGATAAAPPEDASVNAEAPCVAAAVAHLRQAGEEPLARLLDLRSRHGACLLAGLVDYFLCRALQADPRISGAFVFAHVERPQDLWDGDLDALARVAEQHVVRVIAQLDDEPAPRNGNGFAPRDDLADRLFRQGVDSYQTADYHQAVTLFSAALRHDPEYAAVYAYRGDAYRLLCEYDLAITDYSAAIRLNPAGATVLIQRAAAYRLTGDLGRSVADCTAAIAVDPRLAPAYSGRADTYLELGALDQAVADYSAAVALQPVNPWAFFGRGQAHLQKRAFAEAVADFTHVLALNPHHVLAQLHRGDAARGLGDLAQAILDYSEVLRFHPRNTAAYARRGVAFQEKGETERAIGDFTQALRLDPKNAPVYCSRGALLRRKGDLERALSDLDESMRYDAGNGAVHFHRGLVFMARGRFKEALADFDQALRLSPDWLEGYLARALAQDRLGRQPEAIQDCSRALRQDENCVAAYLIRGVIGSHSGQYAQAHADLTRAIEMNPHVPLAYHERGMVYMLQGEYDHAVADYTQMLELNPTSALAYAARGVVRQMQDRHADAVADFARALELNPKSILAGWHQNLADGIRRRITQMLVDCIEGVWPKPPDAAASRRREVAPRTVELTPEGAETAELPARKIVEDDDAADDTAAPPPAKRRKRTRHGTAARAANGQPPPSAAETQARAAALTAEAPAAAEAPVEEMSVEVELVEAEPADDAAGAVLLELDADGDAPTAPNRQPPTADAQTTAAPSAGPPLPLQCPTCKVTAEPAERLPDGRARCGNCKSAFVPTRAPTVSPSPGRSPVVPANGRATPAKAPAKPKKPRMPDDDGDDLPRMTRKQKLVLGTAAVLVSFVLLYYFFPDFDSFGSAGPIGRRIAAQELVDTFAKSRRAASAQFHEAEVVVCGEVGEVSEEKRMVRFKARNGQIGIEASFASAGDMSGARVDQKVAIAGGCRGIQKTGNVMLSLCKLFPYEEPPSANAPTVKSK